MLQVGKAACIRFAHNLYYVVTCCVFARFKRITFARKDEAAGNDGLPSGANALQARQEAQDFRRGKSDAALRRDLNVVSKAVSLLMAESPRRLPALAAQLRAFSSLSPLPPLQSTPLRYVPFRSLSRETLPSARYRQSRCI